MKLTLIKISVIAVASLFSTGCATDPRTGQPSLKETFASDDPCSNNARNTGIVLGTIAGAVLGNQVEHSNTARLLGAAAGGLLGGAIGKNIDQRRCELYKIAKTNKLEMKMEDIKLEHIGQAPARNAAQPASGGRETTQPAQETIGMKVTIKDNQRQFASGSDELTPEAASYFRQIATQYSYTRQRAAFGQNPTHSQLTSINGLRNRRILLVGHTDDTGSSRLNADLSERRAKAVAKIFQEQGILDENIYFQGAGETLPVADNRTEDGRARNRRVEIIDLADDAAFRAFLARRVANVAYYRNTSVDGAVSAASRATDRDADSKIEVAASSLTKSGKTDASAPSRKPESSTTPSASKKIHPVIASSSTGRQPVSQAMKASAPVTIQVAGKADASIDFGGSTDLKGAVIDIGKVTSPAGGFSFIPTAHADVPVVSSCINDRPRIAHGVKSLKGDIQYETADYMPGLYQTSWADNVNGHLVAMTSVAVLRDGGVPANRPNLLIYRDYKPGMKPLYAGSPDVNVYRGDKAVLYRVFVDGPVKCIDMVIPHATPGQAPGSHLFYSKSTTTYVTDLHPRLAKN